MRTTLAFFEHDTLAQALSALQRLVGGEGYPRSMRSLARGLGVSTPGYLQELIAGKRMSSEDGIRKMGELFLLSELEVDFLVALWMAGSANPEFAARGRVRVNELRARASVSRPRASSLAQRQRIISGWRESLESYFSREVASASLMTRCSPEGLCQFNDLLASLAWELRGSACLASPDAVGARNYRVVLAAMPMARSTKKGRPFPLEECPPVDTYRSYRTLLADRLSLLMARNPKFSYRRVAQVLKESDPGFAQKVIRGKRHLDGQQALKLSLLFGFSECETRYFCGLVELENHGQKPVVDSLLLTRLRGQGLVVRDNQSVFSSWLVTVVHILSSLPDFKECPHWVSQALNGLIDEREAEVGLHEAREKVLLACQREGTRPVGTLIQHPRPDVVNPLHGGAFATLERGLLKGVPMQWEDFTLSLAVERFAEFKAAITRAGRDIMYLSMQPEYLEESVAVQIGLYAFPEK